MNLSDRRIVFYDSDCVLCNNLVKFILKHDRKLLFYFAPLQRIAVLTDNEIALSMAEKGETIVYWNKRQFYDYSNAVLKIVVDLGGIWKLCKLLYVIPNPIRDLIYRYVSKYRYRIFGKTDQCIVVDENQKLRFL